MLPCPLSKLRHHSSPLAGEDTKPCERSELGEVGEGARHHDHPSCAFRSFANSPNAPAPARAILMLRLAPRFGHPRVKSAPQRIAGQAEKRIGIGHHPQVGISGAHAKAAGRRITSPGRFAWLDWLAQAQNLTLASTNT